MKSEIPAEGQKRVSIWSDARNVGDRLKPEEMLDELLVKRYYRLTGLTVVTAGIDALANRKDRRGTSRLQHPDCAGCEVVDCCQDEKQIHTAELYRHRKVHWHKCETGKWCAVALVDRKRCRAEVCKVVASGELSVEDFDRKVEILDILIENLLARHDAFFSRLSPQKVQIESASEDSTVGSPIAIPFADCHPQVRCALKYIEENASDPRMNVARIAQELGINSTYLAHLFSEQVGVWMSRYIAAHRIELSKKLLMNSNWQIKKVAHESGHGNADWFSEVFREHTGVTPSEYRRNMGGR